MNENDAWVVEVDASNFEKEVIERSRAVPVVVDFWATWCEPCKTLGPVLERLAREGAGRFLLAKVDVDKNPELAQMFRVQGIPAVLGIVDGRIVDGFQGALPEPELLTFLDAIAPARSGVLERAETLAGEGQADEAVALLRDHLRQRTDDDAARLVLGRLLVEADKLREAGLVLEKLSEGAAAGDEARALLARLGFAESSGDLDEARAKVAERPDDHGARIELGKALVAAGEQREGLENLMLVIERTAPSDKVHKSAKQALLETFELLGLEDPLANEYRFKLSMVLFA